MADTIRIVVQLDTSEIQRASQTIQSTLKNALSAVSNDFKTQGKAFGSSLASGIAEGLGAARQIQQQLNQVLNPSSRHRSNEAAEATHQQKLELIHERSVAKQLEIEAKSQAQLASLRQKAADTAERDARRVAEAAERAARRAAPPDSAIGFFKRYSSVIREAGESIQFAAQPFLNLSNSLVNLGRNAVEQSVKLDAAKRALVAINGSAAEASQQLTRLREIAKLPGIDFEGAITGATRLQAVGFSAAEAERSLKAFSNAIAITGGGAEQLRSVSIQLAQLSSKGKVLAQDLRPIIEAAPILGRVLKDAFGTVDSDQISKQLEKAGKSSKDFINIITEGLEKLPRVIGGPKEALENFQISANQALAKVGDSVLRLLVPALEKLGPLLEKAADSFAQLSPETQTAIVAITAMVAAIGPLMLITGSLIQNLGAIGNLITVFAGVTAQAGTAAAATAGTTNALAGGLTAVKVSLLGINPVILAITGLLAAGAIGWFTYSNAVKSATDQLDLAGRKARAATGEFQAVDGSGPVTKFGNKFIEPPWVQVSGNADLSTKGVDLLTGLPKSQSAQSVGGGSSGIRSGFQSALNEQKKFAEAQRQLELARVEQLNSILKLEGQQRASIYQEQYDADLISTREFYDARLNIESAQITRELDVLKQSAIGLEQARTTAKGTEKIQIEQQLLKVYTEQRIKVLELTGVLQQNFSEFKKAIGKPTFDLNKLTQESAYEVVDPRIQAARDRIAERTAILKQKGNEYNRIDLDLREKELTIQNQIAAGLLTEAEGKQQVLAIQRQYRDSLIESLQAQQELAAQNNDTDAVQRLRIQIESLRGLGQELTPLQSFIKGFRSQADTLAESFEKIGTKFKDSILNVVDSGIDRLTKKLGFFKDLVGDILKSFTRLLLGNLLQPRLAQGSGSNFLNTLLGGLGGGSASGGGGLGGFLTPSFGGGFPSIGGSGGGGGVLQALGGLVGGGGISAPPSISNLPIIDTSGLRNQALQGIFGKQSLGSVLLGNFKNLFQGFGFGLKGGSATGALAAAAPLLGLSLGSGLGGQSLLGKLLGGAGGALLGIGLTAAPAALAAGGALAGSLGFLAPLFSNPITAAIGAILLPAAWLFGRAKQRKSDEEQSGVWLQSAVDAIKNIKQQVATDQVDGTQAKSYFETEVLAGFISQINTLKTKSVRESRLTNQVRDLRNLFDSLVGPEITAQASRKKSGVIGRNLIPEFASGGMVPGIDKGYDSVLSLLRPREMVLTMEQQSHIARMAGPDIFTKAGVPGVQQSAAFATGGIVPLTASREETSLSVSIYISEGDMSRVVVGGLKSSAGRSQVIKAVQEGRLFRAI